MHADRLGSFVQPVGKMGGTMEHLNLILKFKLEEDAEVQVKGAARISVDGHGGLVIHDAGNDAPQRISLARLHSFWIYPINTSSRSTVAA